MEDECKKAFEEFAERQLVQVYWNKEGTAYIPEHGAMPYLAFRWAWYQIKS